jgi:hypothetical protein
MRDSRTVRRWWGQLRNGYGQAMRQPVPARRVAAQPRPKELDDFVGKWVAVIDGEVVTAADSSHQLALQLHDMDHRRRAGVVVEYVRPSTDSYIVGVG